MSHSPWFVYFIQCADNSIYTGIAKDVKKRYAEHVAGKGARYTRMHVPQKLLVQFACTSQSAALKLEYALKQCSALEKQAIIKSQQLPAALTFLAT